MLVSKNSSIWLRTSVFYFKDRISIGACDSCGSIHKSGTDIRAKSKLFGYQRSLVFNVFSGLPSFGRIRQASSGHCFYQNVRADHDSSQTTTALANSVKTHIYSSVISKVECMDS
ncbi:hypothetical protein BGZ83_006169 [Gryganskiella cystojenkinii]|nr:hypothetical protein BGZ83_006169 [Gryganskiella cystojenkinii]